MKSQNNTNENAHIFLAAMGEIGDDLILSAQLPAPAPISQCDKGSRVSRILRRGGWVAAAAVLLIAAILLPLMSRTFVPAHDSADYSVLNDGLHYMSYEGPVMPLSADESYPALSVLRALTYDFSAFGYGSYSTAQVYDQYTLTNTGDEAITAQLLYPFSATLAQEDTRMPTLTLGEQTIAARLIVGAADTAYVLQDARKSPGYEDYVTLLSDGSYYQNARSPAPALNFPVTIYAISDYAIHGKGTNPTLNISFSMDPQKTGVMTVGFNGGTNDADKGYYARHVSIPAPDEYGYGEVYYLVFVGEDIRDYTLQGYEDGGCDRGEEIDITAKVTRYESTLLEFIQTQIDKVDFSDALTQQYNADGESVRRILSHLTQEEYLAQIAKLLTEDIEYGNYTQWGYHFRTLEEILSAVRSSERVMCLAFEVSIPAGESVQLCASMKKDASVNYAETESGGFGFDMICTLGSTLSIQGQTITVTGSECVTVTQHNLATGVSPAVPDAVTPIGAPFPADTPISVYDEHCYLVVQYTPKAEE
ncbi:MAG: hypothetical protein IJW40_03740 [Clostridia bacterium]|nr:hypothetical protein [Clostridia bacterium]